MTTTSGTQQRWLVTGACGQLGGHLTARLGGGPRRVAAVTGVARRPCPAEHGRVLVADIEQPGELERVFALARPTHVVHLAAISSPVRAEAEPDRAWRLHRELATRLAALSQEAGAWMLGASTDFVWDGVAGGLRTEREVPRRSPGVYGASKLAGERAVLAQGGAVARFSLLYGLPVCPRPSTWTRLLAALREGREVPAVVDEFRTPLPLAEAARVVQHLGTGGFRGLVNVGGPEVLTPIQLITRLAADAGLPARVRPVGRADSRGGPLRPRNVALDTRLLRSLVPPPVRTVAEGA